MAIAGAGPAAADDVQFWPTLSLYTPTVDGWRGSVEVHLRWTDDLSEFNRAVFRLNGGRLVTPRLELFAGYENTQPAARLVRQEHRIWEQIEYTVRRGPWAFANRGRLEQRFVEGADAAASRFRYRFRVQHHLPHSRWLLAATDEVWFHLNTARFVGQRGVDQNRIAVTAARTLSPRLSVEPGYMFVYTNRPAVQRNVHAHVVTLQVTARF